MSGHRDDGTFADDKAHHPNRKVDRQRKLPFRDQTPYHLRRVQPPNAHELDAAQQRMKDYGISMNEALNQLRGTTSKLNPTTKNSNNDFIGEHSNENDETLDPWDQEDIDEQKRFRDEANKRGHL